MYRALFFLAIILGAFWWFAPQTTRERAADATRTGAGKAIGVVVQYRDPIWTWTKGIADVAYDKALAVLRAQLHRAVDENVQ